MTGPLLPAATSVRRGAFRRFRDLGTARKLLAGFLLMCALVVGVGLFGLSRLGAANDRLDSMYADDLTPITALGAVDSDLERERQLLLQLALEHLDDKAGVLA